MDKKAKEILFKTYWSCKGWKNQYITNANDFIYAKEQGVMFDPVTISHDECIERIIELSNTITLEQVAKAFLSSLSTRRLEWRSAIASFYMAKNITKHKYVAGTSGYFLDENGKRISASSTCDVCGDLDIYARKKYEKEDLNILNFERIKWGGIRHNHLLYLLFDLERFQKEEIPEPTEMDIQIMKEILQKVNSCKKEDYPSILREKLKEISSLGGNKDERSVTMEILACIGILQPKSYDRGVKGRYDWHFMICWRGEDGYDKEKVEQYFGKYLSN